MAQESITGDHIISSLKTLGFTESEEKDNRINLSMENHKISVPRGSLDSNEETRLRTELAPIFKTLDSKIQESSDRTLLSVRDWLASPST
jgi:hypothetical protein